jgi:hypothetical protein
MRRPLVHRRYRWRTRSTSRWARTRGCAALHLAASTMESAVAQALEQLRAAGTVPTAEQVRALVAPERPDVPALAVSPVDLAEYDALLAPVAEGGA